MGLRPIGGADSEKAYVIVFFSSCFYFYKSVLFCSSDQAIAHSLSPLGTRRLLPLKSVWPVRVPIKLQPNWYDATTACRATLNARSLEGSIGTAEGRNLLPTINDDQFVEGKSRTLKELELIFCRRPEHAEHQPHVIREFSAHEKMRVSGTVAQLIEKFLFHALGRFFVVAQSLPLVEK